MLLLEEVETLPEEKEVEEVHPIDVPLDKVVEMDQWVHHAHLEEMVCQGPSGPQGLHRIPGPPGPAAPGILSTSGIDPNMTINIQGLETSFHGLGHIMLQVLNAHQHTNFNMQKQLQHAHDTHSAQVEALRELTHANNQRSFYQLFVAIELFDGEDPTTV